MPNLASRGCRALEVCPAWEHSSFQRFGTEQVHERERLIWKLQSSYGGFVLVLSFDSREIRDVCEQRDVAIDQLGEGDAKILFQRLADLDAALNMGDILVGLESQPADSYTKEIFMTVGERKLLVLTVNHHNVATPIDWETVSRIKILRIEDRREKRQLVSA